LKLISMDEAGRAADDQTAAMTSDVLQSKRC